MTIPLNISVFFSGGDLAYSAEDLPAGLTMDKETGLITGFPTSAGVSTVSLTARNVAGAVTTTFTWTIEAAEAQTSPANTSSPFIVGAAEVGSVLTADPGAWTGEPAPTFSYQWRRDEVDIPEAVEVDYRLAVEDDLRDISVTVTGENDLGASEATAASRTIAHPAPEAAGALPDLALTVGSGPRLIDASEDFSGATGGVWSVSGGDATIDQNGVVTISTDTATGQAEIVVRYENSGGSATSGFTLTVTSAQSGAVSNQVAPFGALTTAGAGGFQPKDGAGDPVPLTAVTDQTGAVNTWSISGGYLVCNAPPAGDDALTLTCSHADGSVELTVSLDATAASVRTGPEMKAAAERADLSYGDSVLLRRGFYAATTIARPGDPVGAGDYIHIRPHVGEDVTLDYLGIDGGVSAPAYLSIEDLSLPVDTNSTTSWVGALYLQNNCSDVRALRLQIAAPSHESATAHLLGSGVSVQPNNTCDRLVIEEVDINGCFDGIRITGADQQIIGGSIRNAYNDAVKPSKENQRLQIIGLTITDCPHPYRVRQIAGITRGTTTVVTFTEDISNFSNLDFERVEFFGMTGAEALDGYFKLGATDAVISGSQVTLQIDSSAASDWVSGGELRFSGAHADAIQFNYGGQTVPVDGITIRGLQISRGVGTPRWGDRQGILFSNADTISNLTIEGCIISTTSLRGISVDFASGALIRNNTVVKPLGFDSINSQGRISITSDQGGNVIENNIYNAVSASAATLTNNLTMAYDATAYGNNFDAPITGDVAKDAAVAYATKAGSAGDLAYPKQGATPYQSFAAPYAFSLSSTPDVIGVARLGQSLSVDMKTDTTTGALPRPFINNENNMILYKRDGNRLAGNLGPLEIVPVTNAEADANRVNSGIAALSNFLNTYAPGKKFILADLAEEGTARDQLADDSNLNRYWSDDQEIIDALRTDGYDIDLVIEFWYASDRAVINGKRWAQTWSGIYTKQDEFGNPYAYGDFVNSDITTSGDKSHTLDHSLWSFNGAPDQYDGAMFTRAKTKFIQMDRAFWGTSEPRDFFDEMHDFRNDPRMLELSPDPRAVTWGYVASDGHPLRDDPDGLLRSVLEVAPHYLQAAGVNMELDSNVGTPAYQTDGSHVEFTPFLANGGSLTTIAKFNNFAAEPNQTDGYQEVGDIQLWRAGDAYSERTPLIRTAPVGTWPDEQKGVSDIVGGKLRITPTLPLQNHDRIVVMGAFDEMSTAAVDARPGGDKFWSRFMREHIPAYYDATAEYPFEGITFKGGPHTQTEFMVTGVDGSASIMETAQRDVPPNEAFEENSASASLEFTAEAGANRIVIATVTVDDRIDYATKADFLLTWGGVTYSPIEFGSQNDNKLASALFAIPEAEFPAGATGTMVGQCLDGTATPLTMRSIAVNAFTIQNAKQTPLVSGYTNTQSLSITPNTNDSLVIALAMNGVRDYAKWLSPIIQYSKGKRHSPDTSASSATLIGRHLAPAAPLTIATDYNFGQTSIIAAAIEWESVGSGDVTAPILSSPIDAANGETAATGSVTTDEDNGVLYWVASTSATVPSVAQIQAGNDNTGSPAADSGSQTVSATGSQALSPAPSGLTPGTAYFLHFVHTDTSGNDSNIATGDGFTTDASALTAPSVVNTTATKVTAASTDSVSGTYTAESGADRVVIVSAFTYNADGTYDTTKVGFDVTWGGVTVPEVVSTPFGGEVECFAFHAIREADLPTGGTGTLEVRLVDGGGVGILTRGIGFEVFTVQDAGAAAFVSDALFATEPPIEVTLSLPTDDTLVLAVSANAIQPYGLFGAPMEKFTGDFSIPHDTKNPGGSLGQATLNAGAVTVTNTSQFARRYIIAMAIEPV